MLWFSFSKEKGALTNDEKLTPIGECLAGLPVDISTGKMLLMGSIFRQVEAVMALAATLSVQSPFTNRAYRDPDCEAARKDLDSNHGDPITLLNAYRAWLEIKAGAKGHQSRKWCARRGFEEQRFYEMTKLRQQFRHILQDAGLLPGNDSAGGLSSSSQRSQRHGELQHLRSLKREHLRSDQRKRKVLKLGEDAEDMDDGMDDDDHEELPVAEKSANIDIRDVEFRLQNDSSKVRNLLVYCTSLIAGYINNIICQGSIFIDGHSSRFAGRCHAAQADSVQRTESPNGSGRRVQQLQIHLGTAVPHSQEVVHHPPSHGCLCQSPR